jgi:NAD(P)-dependent dehydrogenase (short-subunit alcohol dehydrogenase family)
VSEENEMEDFNGKVAVITGGASGIGLATARRLAREGMNIVLADIEPNTLERAVADVSALGVEAIGVPTDVGDLAQVQALADRAFERFGAVHLLFNNAGVAISGPIQEMTHADWEWLMRVNLWGVIHGVETFVPRMIEQRQGGHIVSTASFAGLVANDGLGVYCVTKYGVVGLSECLFRDLRNEGIGVSVLCPMRVETNIGNSARNRPPELGGPNETVVHEGPGEDERQLAGGTISADEVAEMVLKAVRNNELYILTHPESRPFVRRRFERIDRAYES